MRKFSECSKIVQSFVAAGTIATAMVAIAVPTVWALETHFVTVSGLEKAFMVRDVRDIKRQIRRLEFLEKKGSITDVEQYELDGLRIELEELSQ